MTLASSSMPHLPVAWIWAYLSPGSCVFLEGLGIPLEPYNLNLPSIGVANVPGAQTVIRTVTSTADKRVNFDAQVKAPKGFEVAVNPKKLQLDPGESATFEVTITNKSAPIGEWRFGSLAWQGGGYDVYSPIAVKGSLFKAPGAVSGSGTSGSASFDVKFGYTGSYAAAPHGLVAPILTPDSISQDPDQTYPSGDDGAGVDKLPFDITGAAFVRFQLVIPGDDDIDLYLENSAGTIIASSTNGGTDELIELTLPADGHYTMVVHGWSVPHEPLPYALMTWIVPLATGELSVGSAPASAVIGTTGTVIVNWSGLSTGTNYLGAVTHTGDAGLLGLTLIEVNTP